MCDEEEGLIFVLLKIQAVDIFTHAKQTNIANLVRRCQSRSVGILFRAIIIINRFVRFFIFFWFVSLCRNPIRTGRFRSPYAKSRTIRKFRIRWRHWRSGNKVKAVMFDVRPAKFAGTCGAL